MISQGYTGNKLLSEFKKLNCKIRPAVKKIITEAANLAKEVSHNYTDTTSDIFKNIEQEISLNTISARQRICTYSGNSQRR